MSSWISKNSVFGWMALGTGLLLLIPLVAMQFTSEVNWGALDFVVMGALLMGAGSLFVLVARRTPQKRHIVIGALIGAIFLLVWAELAVGVFTHLGS